MITPPTSSPPGHVPRLGLVADDLTGATDSAVHFANAGWHAVLLRGGQDLGSECPRVGGSTTELVANGSPAEALLTGGASAAALGAGPRALRPSVLAVSTAARACDGPEAAARTGQAVRALIAQGCTSLFVKIDSTLRGSVAGQLDGALSAWSTLHPESFVVLCPACPDQGRTVVDGRVLVRGVPVDQTAAAADPVTPVGASHLGELLPGSVAVPVHHLSMRELDGTIRPGTVAYTDAATNDDLRTVAAAVQRCGPLVVAAGSSGLAAATAKSIPHERLDPDDPPGSVLKPACRVLVAISSLHPVTAESLAHLQESLAAATPPLELPVVDILTTPAVQGSAALIAAHFGRRVAQRLVGSDYDAVVLVGGDGAAATLDSLDATALTILTDLAPEAPVGILRGGPMDGLQVVTKSGGFGHSETLTQIVHLLHTGYPRKAPS